MFRNNTSLSLIGRTFAFEAKKVIDFRFLILVTRCEKRSKKILRLAVFGVQVAAHLIEDLPRGHKDTKEINHRFHGFTLIDIVFCHRVHRDEEDIRKSGYQEKAEYAGNFGVVKKQGLGRIGVTKEKSKKQK
jgi:hypothetical protein